LQIAHSHILQPRQEDVGKAVEKNSFWRFRGALSDWFDLRGESRMVLSYVHSKHSSSFGRFPIAAFMVGFWFGGSFGSPPEVTTCSRVRSSFDLPGWGLVCFLLRVNQGPACSHASRSRLNRGRHERCRVRFFFLPTHVASLAAGNGTSQAWQRETPRTPESSPGQHNRG